MSSRRLSVELSPEAESDYLGILAYTLATWGNIQHDAYSQALEDALVRIGDQPDIGRVRDDAGADVRGYRVREHVLYYRVTGKKVRILRILHPRMDPARQIME